MRRKCTSLLFLMALVSLAACGCNEKPPGPLQTSKRQPDKIQSPDPEVDDKAEISKDDREVALKRITLAIDAHGAHIGRAKIRHETTKGHTSGLPTEQEIYLSAPDQIRNNVKMQTPMGEQVFTIVLDKSTGWRSGGGNILTMSEAELIDVQSELYYLWVRTLRPLLLGGFELRPLPDSKFRDRPMMGVRVTRIHNKDKKEPARVPMNLWFDKETKLLSRIWFIGHEAGQELHRELFFSEFKTFDSVKLPTRIEEYRNGAPFLESMDINYKILEQLDESLFQRPKS